MARRMLKLGVGGVIASAMVGVFLGVSAATLKHAEATSYLSDDPKACVNCHVMNEHYDGWQKATHHHVATCNDCHVPHDPVGKYLAKMDHGYRHSKAFTLQDFHEPIRITSGDLRIVENNCVRCHSDMVHQITSAQAGQPASCTHCHASVGHGPLR